MSGSDREEAMFAAIEAVMWDRAVGVGIAQRDFGEDRAGDGGQSVGWLYD